jgi:hypothetical protein
LRTTTIGAFGDMYATASSEVVATDPATAGDAPLHLIGRFVRTLLEKGADPTPSNRAA